MHNCLSCNHQVVRTDGLPNALQVKTNFSSLNSCGFAKGQHLQGPNEVPQFFFFANRVLTSFDTHPKFVEANNRNATLLWGSHGHSTNSRWQATQNCDAEVGIKKVGHFFQQVTSGSGPCSGLPKALSEIRIRSKYPSGQFDGFAGRIKRPSPNFSTTTSSQSSLNDFGIRID